MEGHSKFHQATKQFNPLYSLAFKYLPCNWCQTQVGSPAVLFRLARCTSWVKRWSEAMDFFQTIFKITIVYLRDLYGKKTLEICPYSYL